MKNLIICFVVLFLFGSLGCKTASGVDSSPTPMLTSTPDMTPTPLRLHFVDNELEACLLISAIEVEFITGFQVTTEQGYKPTRENIMELGPTSCRYRLKTNGEVVLATSADSDTTLEKGGYSFSASEWFQQMLRLDTDMAEKLPAMIKLQPINGLGEQAYSKTSIRIDITVLNNNVIYWFSTQSIENGGMGYDALLKLAGIALQRAP